MKFILILNDGISRSYACWGIREQDKHMLIYENIKEVIILLTVVLILVVMQNI